MIAKVIMLSLYVTYVTANTLQSSPYRLCENKPPPYFFHVTGCGPTESVCPFYMSSQINSIVTFTIPDATKSMNVKVEFKYNNSSIWWPNILPLNSGCLAGNNVNQCPAKQGQVGSYSTGPITIPFIPFQNNIPLTVKFMLKDDKDRDIFCSIVDAVIKRRPVASSETNYVL
uniref:Teratocyte ML domain-containing protein n=1 Tax=Cotesia flavipes TaxID=89805 RepID=A0A8K1YTU6_COTFL|nr:teratocyte ML domain-containing protein [Cotesia flavipes]